MILHTPVMLQEVLSFLPADSKLIVDCTLGHAWHARELLLLAKDAQLIGFDIDNLMLEKAKWIVSAKDKEQGTHISDRIEYIHGNYADLVSVLVDRKADYVLNDLGVNLEHFKAVERGFSIRGIAPLDMRFDTGQKQNAADIVNSYTRDQLSHIFEQYADFSPSKALELAQGIVTTRKQSPIVTTQDFKAILNACWLGDKACTVIFQSLRVETNKELDNLKAFLLAFPETLNLTWRCVIITYHSIEDRFVKQAFAALVSSWSYRLLTKKAVKPNYKEVAVNRAARSAKLRILEKIAG